MLTFLALSSYLALATSLGAFVGVALTHNIPGYRRDNAVYEKIAFYSMVYVLVSMIISIAIIL